MVTNRLHGLDARANERFLDVANRSYSREFVTGFSYTNHALHHPTVDLSYCRNAETFTGILRASGLKPHFAYQIKLCGDYAADEASFERIGTLGRWRRIGSPATNFTDADVAAAHNKSVFESYVLFDFFISDENGNAVKEFYLDSTLHVLYNQPKQGSPKAVDSRAVAVRFTNTASSVYANPKGVVEPQAVYAQTEAGTNKQVRPDIGDAFLPPGSYRARLALVEETFHSYGDGVFWPKVMDCAVAFEVLPQPTPPSPLWRERLPEGRFIACTKVRPWSARLLHVTPTACKVESDGSGGQPRLVMTNAVPLAVGQRHIAAFDVRVEEPQTLYLFASKTAKLLSADRYSITPQRLGRWQPIELEVTLGNGDDCGYLAVYGPVKGAPWELRNLRIVSLPVTGVPGRPGGTDLPQLGGYVARQETLVALRASRQQVQHAGLP